MAQAFLLGQQVTARVIAALHLAQYALHNLNPRAPASILSGLFVSRRTDVTPRFFSIAAGI
jgi:hypothetical protein